MHRSENGGAGMNEEMSGNGNWNSDREPRSTRRLKTRVDVKSDEDLKGIPSNVMHNVTENAEMVYVITLLLVFGGCCRQVIILSMSLY